MERHHRGRGVEVGHVTLGRGRFPVRTGVTPDSCPLLGRGDAARDMCRSAPTASENGNGEMTGLPWLQEAGVLEGLSVPHHEHERRRSHRGTR